MLTITDDRKRFDEVRANLEGLDDLAGLAGLFEPEQATIGGSHEFGTGRRKRPWLSASTDAATPTLGTEAEREIGAVVDLKQTPRAALGALAETVVEAAVSFVESGQVGGAELSKQAKRNDARKLIDTGAMLDALDTDVLPNSKAER